MNDYISVCYGDDVLVHHGILGQKWGVRRYQNEDGTWTEAGKERYGYTSKATKKAVKRLDKYNKSHTKAAMAYEKRTKNKYVEDDEDREISKVKETRVSANQELDKKFQDIKENRSAGAKTITFLLQGPFANRAYTTLKASGDKGTTAAAKMVVANLLLPFGLGNLALSSISRSSYVDKKVDENVFGK